MKKLISVFGPSSVAPETVEYRMAERLGALLGHAGFAVVSGGYEGVMEAVSKGAASEQGSVIGITAEVYFARGRVANRFVGKEVRVKSAADSLMELIDIADAYVAIGNSTGTMIEVMVAWDYITKRFIPEKPLLLVGESWRKFLEYAESESEFKPYLDLIQCHDTPEATAERLEAIFGTQLRLPELDVLGPTND